MHRRTSLLVAVIAALGLAVAAPMAQAASKTDKAQNKRIKSQTKSIKKNASGLKRNSADVKKLNQSAAAVGSAIEALKVVSARADENGKAFVAAAPAVIKGLSDLKAGLEAAGAGLTSLRTLATSQEYGFGQVIVVSAGPTPNAQVGSFVVTPDIPDTVQQAQTTQKFTANNDGALVVSYGIRSNENDGTGASLPAGLCRVTVTNDNGDTASTTGGPLPGLGQFVPVPNKSTLTSTIAGNEGFPFGLKTVGADADQTLSFNSGITVITGDEYDVQMSCVDTSPSSTDPNA